MINQPVKMNSCSDEKLNYILGLEFITVKTSVEISHLLKALSRSLTIFIHARRGNISLLLCPCLCLEPQ